MPLVNLQDHLFDLLIGDSTEVSALREVTTDHPADLFVGYPLPRSMRVRDKDLHALVICDDDMGRVLGAVIQRQGLT